MLRLLLILSVPSGDASTLRTQEGVGGIVDWFPTTESCDGAGLRDAAQHWQLAMGIASRRWALPVGDGRYLLAMAVTLSGNGRVPCSSRKHLGDNVLSRGVSFQ